MADQNQALAVITQEIASRGIPETTWKTLADTLYPGASPRSVLMVWDYCNARKLDPLKKPVHIVPMRVNIGGQWVDRETVLPGIYEYRTTAHRTGEYLGHDKPIYGPDAEAFGIKAPAWCEFTVYRWNEKAQQKVPYSVRVMFNEVCGTKRKDKNDPTLVANGRWERAPVQMMTKCAEAAALREAFPEEFGGTPTVEEIEDHMPEVIDVTPTATAIPIGWGRVSEALRERIEKAFTALKMSAAQRLAKTNEFIPNDATAEDGAERLLAWCQDEYARQQGKTVKRAEKVDNGKQAQAPAVTGAPVTGESRVDPSGGGSDVRPAGVELPARGSGHEAPAPSDSKRGNSPCPECGTLMVWQGDKQVCPVFHSGPPKPSMTASDIPFGEQPKRRNLSELF